MNFVRVSIAAVIALSAVAAPIAPASAQSQTQASADAKLQALRNATFTQTCAFDATVPGYEEYLRLEVVLTRKAGGAQTLAYHDAKTHQRETLETVVFNANPTGYYELTGTRKLNDDYTFMAYIPDQQRVALYDDQRQPVGSGKCETGDLTAKRQQAYDTRHDLIASRPGYINDVRTFDYRFTALADSWKECLVAQVNASKPMQSPATGSAIVQKAAGACDSIDQGWRALVADYGAYDPDEKDDLAISKLKMQQDAAGDLIKTIDAQKAR